MSQPKWKCIAQLGDNSPMEYGGCWLFVDETGVYPPELEILKERSEGEQTYTYYRIVLQKCYPIGETGVSDNQFHKYSPAWFSDKLQSVSNCVGCDIETLISELCSDEPLEIANGYLSLIAYFGEYEFDQYPGQLSIIAAYGRYRAKRFRVAC